MYSSYKPSKPMYYDSTMIYLIDHDPEKLQALAKALQPYLTSTPAENAVTSPHFSHVGIRAGDREEEEENAASNAPEPHIIYQDRIVYQDKIIEKEVIKTVEKRVEVPTTPEAFLRYENLLNSVLEDSDFRSLFVGDSSDEKSYLLNFVIRAAQWSKVQSLWRMLETRCKNQERAITEDEKALLEACAALYEHATDNPPCLAAPEVGDTFDSREHQRANSSGDTVREVRLPGLRAANGDWVGKPLVMLK